MRRALTTWHDLEVQQMGLWGLVATPVGIGVALVSAAVALSSFLPGAPFVGDVHGVVRASLLLVLPLAFGTLIALRLGGIIGTRNTVQAFLGLPRTILRLTLGVVIAFAVIGLTGSGSPSEDDDVRQAEESRRGAATVGAAYTVIAAAGLLVRKQRETMHL